MASRTVIKVGPALYRAYNYPDRPGKLPRAGTVEAAAKSGSGHKKKKKQKRGGMMLSRAYNLNQLGLYVPPRFGTTHSGQGRRRKHWRRCCKK